MKNDVFKDNQFNRQAPTGYYGDEHLHECIAADNKTIRDRAFEVACEKQGVQLYTANDNFGGVALMQITSEGQEKKLIEGFRNFEIKEVGEGTILIADSVDENQGHSYSLVVGSDSEGYDVVAEGLARAQKDKLVSEYEQAFKNPPEFLGERPQMLIRAVRSMRDLERWKE